MDPSEIDNNLIIKYSFLKRQLKAGDYQDAWAKENLLDGLKKFFDENGRYPTAPEIDKYEYLPSSRQIQRAFGGLVKLRQELGMAITDYGSGENRSKIAFTVTSRGANLEREIEKILIERFGEHFVHIEKPLYKYYTSDEFKKSHYKTRADFFVYAAGDYQFCIDVFYAGNQRTLIDNINHKQTIYSNLGIDVFLVNLNENSDITDESISNYVKNKQKALDKNIKIMNKTKFIKHLDSLQKIGIK